MSLPWFKFSPKHFLEGVEEMTLEERGAYITLLSLMYQRGGPLPDQPRWLAGHCLVSVRAWNTLRAGLLAKGKIIINAEGRLENKRAMSELESSGKPQDKPAEKQTTPKKNSDLDESRGGQDRDRDSEEEKRAAGASPPPPGGGIGGLFGDEEGGGEEPAKPVDQVPIAFAEWNALAKRLSLSIAEVITDDRRKRIKARLAAGGLEAWRRALAGVEASAWCRGERGDFRANLDFVLVPKNFQKLIEGGYGREHAVAAPGGGPLAPAKAKAPFPNAEVRAKVVEAAGEVFTATWLDGCKWRASPRPAIIAPSQTVADRIKREVWLLITGLGLEIITERGRP